MSTVTNASVPFNFRHRDDPNQLYHWNPKVNEVEWVRLDDYDSKESIDYTRKKVNEYLQTGIWVEEK